MDEWRKCWRKRKRPSVAAAKLLRCLGIINALENRPMTIDELAEYSGTSERTVYRYVRLFEEVGYSIDRDFNGRFFIFGKPTL